MPLLKKIDRVKQLILPLGHSPAFEDKDFIVSSANKEAHQSLMSRPQWSHPCLSIYGDRGCGKTHLSHIWQEKTKAQYFTGHDFNRIEIESLLKGESPLILDDAHFIEKEEKLFHFYNHIMDKKRGFLLLSLFPPSQWTFKLPDLKSRLKVIPAIKIHAPDEALLSRLITKLFQDLQVHVEGDVVSFLLKHMERSFQSANTWVEKLNRASLIQKRRVTIPLVRELLEMEARVEKNPQLFHPTNQDLSNDQWEVENQ